MKLDKVTTITDRRWYDDACGTAHALELIGERWALLVVRELMFGPRRFGQLRDSLPGISANILTLRLSGLETAGIVVRRKLPPPAALQVYELTPWGYESEPAIQALGRWAARSPGHDPRLPLSVASLMMSFRTMFDPVRAAGIEASIGFRLGDDGFVGIIDSRGFAVARGDPAAAAVCLAGSAETIAGWVYGGAPLAALEAAGVLAITGNRALAERFVTLFPLPDKVAVARAPAIAR